MMKQVLKRQIKIEIWSDFKSYSKESYCESIWPQNFRDLVICDGLSNY